MEYALSLGRHILTAGGGVLVSKGVLEASQAEAVVGAVMALIGVGFALWAKRKKA